MENGWRQKFPVRRTERCHRHPIISSSDPCRIRPAETITFYVPVFQRNGPKQSQGQALRGRRWRRRYRRGLGICRAPRKREPQRNLSRTSFGQTQEEEAAARYRRGWQPQHLQTHGPVARHGRQDRRREAPAAHHQDQAGRRDGAGAIAGVGRRRGKEARRGRGTQASRGGRTGRGRAGRWRGQPQEEAEGPSRTRNLEAAGCRPTGVGGVRLRYAIRRSASEGARGGQGQGSASAQFAFAVPWSIR